MNTADKNDQDFLDQLEDASLDVSVFNDQSFMRAAWIYLQELSLQEVLDLLHNRFTNYVAKKNLNDQFNMTRVIALAHMVYERTNNNPLRGTWTDFCYQNMDLIEQTNAVLETHYSSELLNSEKAKKDYYPPDLEPFTY